MKRLISAQFSGFSLLLSWPIPLFVFFRYSDREFRASHLKAVTFRKNPALFIGYEFRRTYLETTGFSELPDAAFVRRAERVIER